MSARLLLIHCLSPLHAGTGQSVGAVDLPIAREVATGIPYLPGSSIKGSLRDAARTRIDDKGKRHALFGPDTENASDHAGALAFGDGRLVCMPVRSIYGTFAWTTSPMLLQRLFRDAREAGLELPVEVGEIAVSAIGQARTAENSVASQEERIIFEDLDFSATSCDKTTKVAEWLADVLLDSEGERTAFARRFVVLHDDAMAFLARHAVETVTRASLDHDTKTVKTRQLWTEENLPSESILAALIGEIPVLAKKVDGGAFAALSDICAAPVQFGGHATIGRGRCAIRVRGGA